MMFRNFKVIVLILFFIYVYIVSVSNIFRTIVDLFLAGSETTSNTINWCILYLMEKPDVQNRCYQELQLVFTPLHFTSVCSSVFLSLIYTCSYTYFDPSALLFLQSHFIASTSVPILYSNAL